MSTFFSSASCPETMSKRMQQGTREERIAAKSNPTLNLVSPTAASSSTAPSSSASNRPGILRAPSQRGSNLIAQSAGKLAAGSSNQNDATSSSQVWLLDAETIDSARKLAAARTNQDLSFQECVRKLDAENPEINDEDDSKWPHNLRMSHANVPHLEKVCSNLRQQLKRKPEDRGPRCEYVDIGNVYDCHSASRSSSWKRIFGEFTCNQKSATTNSKTIVRCDKKVVQGSERNPRYFRNRLARKFLEKTTLLTDRAVRLSTAKADVFSDSVLCMGRISESPVSAWKGKLIGS